jgi:phosphoribosyl-ATP pyrophosphohydrolase
VENQLSQMTDRHDVLDKEVAQVMFIILVVLHYALYAVCDYESMFLFSESL